MFLLGSALRTASRGARVAESLQLESQPEREAVQVRSGSLFCEIIREAPSANSPQRVDLSHAGFCWRCLCLGRLRQLRLLLFGGSVAKWITTTAPARRGSSKSGSDWDVQGQMLFNLFTYIMCIYIYIFGIVQTCANTLHGSNCEHQEGLLILVSWLSFWVLVNSWQSLDDSLRQSAGELLHSSTLGVPSDCIRSVYRRAVVGLDIP